jgi:hypothetical protein
MRAFFFADSEGERSILPSLLCEAKQSTLASFAAWIASLRSQ